MSSTSVIDDDDKLLSLLQAANVPANRSSKSTTWYGRIISRYCSLTTDTCKKVVGATFSLGTFIAGGTLRVSTFKSFAAKSIYTTFSCFGIGAGFQAFCENLFPLIFPENALKGLNQFTVDHGFKFWFLFTQLYLYYTEQDPKTKEDILNNLSESFLTSLGICIGQWTIIEIVNVMNTNLGDIPGQHVAMAIRPNNPTIDSNEEEPSQIEGSPNPPAENEVGHSYSYNNACSPYKSCFLFLEPVNPKYYVLSHGLLELCIGITVASLYHDEYFGPPLGAFFISNAAGIALSEAFQSSGLEISNACARGLGRAGFIICNMWGIPVGAFPGNPFAYAFAGVATGVTKSLHKRHFERVPPDNTKNVRLPIIAKINIATNIFFVAGFGLWLANNFNTSTDIGERVALIVCTTTFPIAAITKLFINRRFKWGHNLPITNSIRFYMEDYTTPSALIFCFVEGLNKQGSTVLEEGNLVRSIIVPSVGWTAYMVCLAGSMTTVKPRMPQALSGMSNTLMGALMRGNYEHS